MMAASIIQIPKAQHRPGKAKVICINSKFKPVAGPNQLDPADPTPEPPRAA